MGLVAGNEPPKSPSSPDLAKALGAVIKDDNSPPRARDATRRARRLQRRGEQRLPADREAEYRGLKPSDGGNIDGGIRYFFEDLNLGFTITEAATAELYSILSTCTVDDFSSCLDTLVSGITLELTLEHARTMIEAAEASIAYRQQTVTHEQKYMDAFNQAHTAWTAAVVNIETDVGVGRTDWDDDTAIKDAMAGSSSYIPKIEAWMAKVRRDRLKQIGDTYRWTWPPRDQRWKRGGRRGPPRGRRGNRALGL